MKSNDFTILEKCVLSKAPDYLPEKIKNRIDEIIKAFEYVNTNPYESYFSRNNLYFVQRKEVLRYEKDSDRWYQYLKHLNRLNRCLCLVSDKRMAEAWNKFAKASDVSKDYSILFIWLTNNFCKLIKYEQDLIKFELSEAVQEKFDLSIMLRENPEVLLDRAREVFEVFDGNISLIASDGADCFEDMDKNDPKNKMFLDENGNLPYKINWDLLITDDEYFTFIDIFKKILEKLENQKKLKESRREIIIKSLHNPQSRKKNIDGASEILLAKELYVKFMHDFKKPFYKEIALILNVLFGSPYCENDIVKITKPVRDNYKELENIIINEDYDCLYSDSYIPKGIADNLKK